MNEPTLFDTQSYAVFTAVYNEYDTLKPFPKQDIEGVETFCLTDDPVLLGSGWNRIVLEPMGGVHPNRAAKRSKCCPWEYTNADIVIWIDASIHVTSTSFVREIAEYAAPLAHFLHPERDCIYDEADISLSMPKYALEPIRKQVDHYRERGHPAHWGLWATGISVRRHTPEVEAYGKAWLSEIDEWSYQDQISHPPMLREHGLRPVTIPGGFFAGQNPWLGYEGSLRH